MMNQMNHKGPEKHFLRVVLTIFKILVHQVQLYPAKLTSRLGGRPPALQFRFFLTPKPLTEGVYKSEKPQEL